jgi:hypothetical protein
MNRRTILLLTLFSMSATVATTDAATVFSGSRIIAIDQGQRTITFKTREGETWTLPVTDPDLLNRQPVAKDDQVTIEIDLNDRIVNVAKSSSEVRATPRTDAEDR